MQLTRRQFAAGSLGALAGIALGAPSGRRGWGWGSVALAADDAIANYFDWKQIADGVWVASKGGGNAMILRSGAQCALIDTKNCGWGDTLKREVAELGGTIYVVVNTHHHGDHIGGNPSFKKSVPVLAHSRAGKRAVDQSEQMLAGMARLLKQLETDPQDTPPQVVAEVRALADNAASIKPTDFASTVPLGLAHDIGVGKVTMNLRHIGAGHTDNDLFVFVPEMNLMHTGDLVFNKLHPYMDVPAGANSRGWQKSLAEMITMCNEKTIVIPGHGEVTDVEGLRGQFAYFDTLRAIVGEAREKGATREEVIALQPEQLKSFGFERMQASNLGVIFDELVAEGNS